MSDSVFDTPEDDLDAQALNLRQLRLEAAQSAEQREADRSALAHLNNRVVVLRGRLDEALERVAQLEAEVAESRADS